VRGDPEPHVKNSCVRRVPATRHDLWFAVSCRELWHGCGTTRDVVHGERSRSPPCVEGTSCPGRRQSGRRWTPSRLRQRARARSKTSRRPPPGPARHRIVTPCPLRSVTSLLPMGPSHGRSVLSKSSALRTCWRGRTHPSRRRTSSSASRPRSVGASQQGQSPQLDVHRCPFPPSSPSTWERRGVSLHDRPGCERSRPGREGPAWRLVTFEESPPTENTATFIIDRRPRASSSADSTIIP
jgi:hypothetical protein